MAKNVLLTVDLKNATSDQRQKFNEALAKEHWKKHPRLTTIWTAVFEDGVSGQGAINVTRKDVSTATAEASISAYDVLIHVGDSVPTEYSVPALLGGLSIEKLISP